MPAMQGKVCLVTGATSGIGLVAARELARQGARVLLVGRSETRCAAAVRHIQEQTGNSHVEALLADLSVQQQIRQLADTVRERHPRLDVLVNNAGGIGFQRLTTADGLERTFAVNHLAYFLLTNLLLDLLRASAPARIVNVSSRAHQGPPLDFENLMGENRYRGWRAYQQSKLANLLFTYELARRLEGTGVTVNALHPGWVATGFGDSSWKGRLLKAASRWFALTPEQGARTVVYLATSPVVAGVSGQYFANEKPAASSAASHDADAARRLWQFSEQLTGLSPASSP